MRHVALVAAGIVLAALAQRAARLAGDLIASVGHLRATGRV